MLKKIFPAGRIFGNLASDFSANHHPHVMSQRKSPKGTRRKAGAGANKLSLETRREFLRLSGAGVAGFVLHKGSSARAADNTGLEIVDIDPNNTIYVNGSSQSEGYVFNAGDWINVFGTNPDVVDFNIQPVGSGENVVTYDNEDTENEVLEVDFIVDGEVILEQFEEYYDPEMGGTDADSLGDCPFTVTLEDNAGTIGING